MEHKEIFLNPRTYEIKCPIKYRGENVISGEIRVYPGGIPSRERVGIHIDVRNFASVTDKALEAMLGDAKTREGINLKDVLVGHLVDRPYKDLSPRPEYIIEMPHKSQDDVIAMLATMVVEAETSRARLSGVLKGDKSKRPELKLPGRTATRKKKTSYSPLIIP
jgi:hypothetical protein